MRIVPGLLAAFLLACTVVPSSATADEQDVERELDDLVRAQAEPASPQELETLAKAILRDVAVVRELSIKKPVSMEVATREQIVAYVDSRIREEMKDEELLGQEAALKRLGLIPEKLDLRKFLLDLYGEQVAGYYDPFKQKFFIASWMAPQLQAPIMAHELTHALQDQHFNLKPFLTPIPENSDATSARQAVVEGDAVIAMFAYLTKTAGVKQPAPVSGVGSMLRSSMTSPQYPVFASAPPYFQEALFFPYADGADFVAKLKGTGTFKPITGLYKDLPRSSEQILHPEKYTTERDDPTSVAVADKLDGWSTVHTDVLGELVVRTMMAGFLDTARATTIGEGWDGDRYRAFQRTSKKKSSRSQDTMILLRTVWDTPDDAKEFFDGYLAMVPEKYDGASRKKLKEDGSALFTTVEDGLVHIELRGNAVLVIDGAPDEETVAAARSAGWGKS